MDDAWQSQDMAPSNPTGGISIPTSDVNLNNGSGIPAGEDQSWAPSAHSPRGTNGDMPSRRSRSRSPGARNGDDRGRENAVANTGSNLHVSGLDSSIGSRDLESAFAKVGRVRKASIMYDPHTRESRCFGFVEMETPEEADAAITAMNDTVLFDTGKSIKVEKARRARARTPTPGRYHGPPKRDRERPYHPSYRDRGGYDRGYPPPRGYDRDYRGGGGGGGGGYDRYDRYDDRPRRYDDYRGGGRYDDGPRWDDRRDYYGDRGYDRRY